MLSHTAGIPDDYSSETGYGYDIVALRKTNVLFAPGTAWSYSNDGYRHRRRDPRAARRRTWADALTGARVVDRSG